MISWMGWCGLYPLTMRKNLNITPRTNSAMSFFNSLHIILVFCYIYKYINEDT